MTSPSRMVAFGGALFVVSAGCKGVADGSLPPAPSYAEARAVVDRHCVSCHSERPTIPAFPIAPGDIVLDTAAQMQRHAQRLVVRTSDGTMPLLNKTGMSERERRILRRWVEAGASDQ